MNVFEINRIYNVDCVSAMEQLNDKSVDLTLTDIPYGECSGRSGDLRVINKGVADVADFDLRSLIQTIVKKNETNYLRFLWD